jgi:nucleotide-binding universal stress UspA family protein
MATVILVPVDGSPSAQRALELLASYQGPKDALRVATLNVQSPAAVMAPEAAVAAQSIEQALLEGGARIAEKAAEQLRAAGLAAEAAVRLGPPASEIGEEAKARGAALVVMGTRGHGALRGFALGSVALRVSHGADTPVLLLHPDAKLPAAFGKKLRVMLAMDGSEPALRAAQALAAWRPWLGELDVQLVHVEAPHTVAEDSVRAAQALFKAESIKSHLHLSAGDAAEEIVHLAGHAGCEMIALGTRGKGAAHHALVGSVALKVAAASALPVLLVK